MAFSYPFGPSRDACVAPVLDVDEIDAFEHNRARRLFVDADGTLQPSVAPRLSATPGSVRTEIPEWGAHVDEILTEIGYSDEQIADMVAGGAAHRPPACRPAEQVGRR